MFIDTHSHLYLGELQNHIPEAIQNLRDENFSHTIQIGTSVETSQICIDLSGKYDIVRATVAVHPCEAQDIDIQKIPEQMNALEKMIQENKEVVGLGEIGFDQYHLSSDQAEAEVQKSRQIEWFRAQAQIAKKHNLPVVIHTRNCPLLTLEELESSGLQKFVVHCFSEDWAFAEKVFELSPEAKISFTGILTYPKSGAVQEVAKKSPLHRIMIETDAPYLIPENLKGQVSYCEPAHSKYVYEKLCELRSESREEIEATLWENSVNFFNL